MDFEPDTCHYGDGTDAWDNMSAICAGTDHLHVGNDITPCRHCREMAAGETISDSLGVRIGLETESLRFRVVALPCDIPTWGIHAFAPTIVLSMDVPSAVHRSFVNECQGPVANILSDPLLRDPEDSSEWGLTHHHEDLVFYPINEVRSDEVHNCLTNHPSIVVIEEFNWEDRSPRFAQIRMNLL